MRAISAVSSSPSCTSRLFRSIASSGSTNTVCPVALAAVNHAGNRAAVRGAHRNHEAVVSQRDVILARRLAARAQNAFERMLNCRARLHHARADALQLRRSVVADFAVGQYRAANRGRKRRKSASAAARSARRGYFAASPLNVCRTASPLPRAKRHRAVPLETAPTPGTPVAPASFRISQRAEAKLRAGAQIGDRLAISANSASSAATSCRGASA